MKFGWLLILSSLMILADGLEVPVSFSAKFMQKVTNPKKKVIIYEGTVRMNRPNILKWRYIKPTRKEVCSDGNYVTIIDHDLEQVSIYKIDKGFDLAEVLKQAKKYKDHLYLAHYGERYYTIATDDKNQIEQIAYRDDLDNIVNIHFINMQYSNHTIPQKLIRCNIPINYDRTGE